MSELIVLGWREWLTLPELGIRAIRAKVDTGARSSSLHVAEQTSFQRNGEEWVRFLLDPDNSGHGMQWAEARVMDRRHVTDSGGHSTERVFIRTALQLADQTWVAEVNLTQRRNMLFPMLLGRTAMAGRFLVNPAASFLLGESLEASP